MASATLTIRLHSLDKRRLDKLAKYTGRSRSSLVAEAITQYLELGEWQVAGIKRAITSLDHGKGIGHVHVKKWVSSWSDGSR